MSGLHRLTVTTALGAVSLGVALTPSLAMASTPSSGCTSAQSAATSAAHQVRTDHRALVTLLHANGHSKANRASVKAARATLRADQTAWRAAHRVAVKACEPGSAGASQRVALERMGTVLHALSSTGTTTGTTSPTPDPTQITSYLNSLFPGLSSSLNTSQFQSILTGFQSAAPVGLTQLQSLLANIPGLGSIDVSQLSNPATLTTLVQGLANSLTSLLGTTVTPTSNPASIFENLANTFLTQLQGSLGSSTGAGSLSGLLSFLNGLNLPMA